MGAQSNQRNHKVVHIPLGTEVATIATILSAYLHASRKVYIEEVALIDGAGISEDASNYLQVQLKKGATVVAEVSTAPVANGGHGSAPQHDALLGSVVADQELQSGVLTVGMVLTGTGKQLTSAVLAVRLWDKESA